MAKRKMSAAQRKYFGKRSRSKARGFARKTSRGIKGIVSGDIVGEVVSGVEYGILDHLTEAKVTAILPTWPLWIKQSLINIIGAKFVPMAHLKKIFRFGLGAESYVKTRQICAGQGLGGIGSTSNGVVYFG